MTSIQKVIKYIAIAFACFLIFAIISGILSAILGISFVFNITDGEPEITEMKDIVFEETTLDSLDIDIAYANLIIKNGENISVSTNNSNIKSKLENGKLTVEDTTTRWINGKSDVEVIVYIPRNIELDKIDITTGAGNTVIEELNVYNAANIECGAGNFEISSGSIKNLDLDIGVGKVDIATTLIGKCDIDAGVGELVLNINGRREDYSIDVDKGIGVVKIDGNELSDSMVDRIYSENLIDIDGGIGSITVSFSEK